jgi:hypothetical protein
MVIGAISFTLNRVRVYFSTSMLNIGVDTNFSIPGTSITDAVPSSDATYVDIETSGMSRSTLYTVSVSSPPVVDGSSQVLAVNTADFYSAISFSDFNNPASIDVARISTPKIYNGDVFSELVSDVSKISAAEALFECLENQTIVIRKYSMRAQKISDSSFVWWVVSNSPDLTGAQSGFPPSELTDVVIESYFDEIN